MIYNSDKWLKPYKKEIDNWHNLLIEKKNKIAPGNMPLKDAVNNYLYYGVHKDNGNWVFREWAPNATALYIICDKSDWRPQQEFRMEKIGDGNWQIYLSENIFSHKDLYKYYIEWEENGVIVGAERLPAYATRCIQDIDTKIFSAQIWSPPMPYKWKNGKVKCTTPFIYEVHIGMSGEEEGVSSFTEFKDNVLPHISKMGYNAIQIMALQEHPYYGSFGYQVSNFFALSSRFGTPDEFKELVDQAHKLGIAVIMDIVHSHAVKNEIEGLSRFDGTYNLYFHDGEKGEHPAWKTRCFDYGKDATLYFLLSNCKFWLEEYNLDGFRFDGITSMLYFNHGLEQNFIDYSNYYTSNTDASALIYLGLANTLIKEIDANSLTIAEDMSGMPGLASPIKLGGWGFDYRLAMGVPDYWIKLIKEVPDEDWDVGQIWWELTNKREDEKTISYAESHDQAMVGDKTIIFRLLDSLMYTSMDLGSESIILDRGIALHKMIRLSTLAMAGDGYLNFMGNEFGHPEWIDFPREGNGWSYKYARRQWSLAKSPFLRYGKLMDFDKEMINLFKKEGILKHKPISLFNDIENKILVIERGGFLFVFNFNPQKSFIDYPIKLDKGGKYKVVLDTDLIKFNGFGRNDDSLEHFTLYQNGENILKLYLPQRMCLMLKLI